MWRLALGVAALGFAAMAMAAADPSRYEKFGLEITFPERWIVGAGEPPLLLMSRSMDQVSLANCVATGEEIAGTKSLSQDQLNLGLSEPFGEQFWRETFAASGLVAEVKSQGARPHKSGITIQEARFDLSKPGAPAESKMTVHQAVFVRPGQTVVVACSTRATTYPQQADKLAAVIDSVRFDAPQVPVASAEAKSVPVRSTGISTATAKKASGAAALAGSALLDMAK